ncbi:YrhK family protein [Marinococcus sp. PL1-022]|uniref:YrhK family protein n=1 Tax=Marinococcus sp. PL1-022 TaxID=3095363 RepID=UPI002633071E|nr:YrhK family protein [Marinococcus sp. PL1-022]MDX6151601.1 YrhK family protein [Marinococcus sp. PL1-022]
MGKNIDLVFGGYELRITKVYQLIYHINDLMLALVFLVGSFLFFSETTTFYGTWLFVLGSLQMFIRPVIALAHQVHVNKVRKQRKEYAGQQGTRAVRVRKGSRTYKL